MIVSRTPCTAAMVAEHYDELDSFYREVWGDHIHHGLWTTGRESVGQAVEALLELVEKQLMLQPGQHVCDVGCGYGAGAEWLADRSGCHVTGLTVSDAQVTAGSHRRRNAHVRLHCGDWLHNTYEGESFDGIFAIESTEHMADKQGFFDQAFRTLRRGGKLAVCAWLARTGARHWEQRFLLEPICREGRLAGMGTEVDYRGWAARAGFVMDDFQDLSERVSRTWTICLGRVARLILTDPRYRRYLLDPGARNRIFAVSLLRIRVAYATGAMRYGLLVAHKP